MMTREQEHVIGEAVVRGLAKNQHQAHEAGCAALRRQLEELKREEQRKLEFAERAEAEAIASDRHNGF